MNVLTTGSTITCGHATAGHVLPDSAAKLAVAGEPVLLEAGVTTFDTACTPVSSNDKPCGKVRAITGGRSAKLLVGGSPVLLASLAGTTDGQIGGVAGALTVTSSQTTLGAP
ncbi:hypothetical protein [Actinomadura fibrosa]|uniref:PAAR domain-containing protein n=1 Tax=Actinomadura fibrosa TaxID=111802 RepID=A0ABW2XVI8_9ACTN|nr:hypothetical protein [Actinomadura fibrosa]